jgi:endonuclease-8
MEGPSLIILREEMAKFVGKRPVHASSAIPQIPTSSFQTTLKSLDSWGKHLLMGFGKQVFKVHFLMFGSYRIDDEREGRVPKLHLEFRNGSLNFYCCSIQHLTSPVEELYDWRVDLMSSQWDVAHVGRLVAKQSSTKLCDLLLDQDVFAGSGNIIKNEVLYNLRLHPEAQLEDCKSSMRRKLIRETHAYAQRFYEWKKAFVLKRNWRIYRKRKCPLCQGADTMQKTGTLRRVSFFCPACQPVPDR